MNQPNSSTSNSESAASEAPATTPAAPAPQAEAAAQAKPELMLTWRGFFATVLWFLAFLLGFEVLVLGLQRVGGAAEHLNTYFDYGTSVESKLRVIGRDPNLAERHVFNAGWLDDVRLPPSSERYDVAVYGMSFARNLVFMLEELRPALKIRSIYGPGAPLSHAYAVYREDAPKRQARAVLIPILSDGIPYLTSMTHDTVEPDHVQPMTWPRYVVRDGEPVLAATPVIRSADALRHALSDDPGLWQRHLAMLAEHDSYFSRILYASHWSERFATLRLVRRALTHARTHDVRAEIKTHAGFIPGTEAAELARALLRRYIRDVRSSGELPIVVLFDSPGEPNWLQALLGDIVAAAHVPVIRSQDHCDAGHRENFDADGHYLPPCVRAIAAQLIDVLDRSVDSRLAADHLTAPRTP